MNRSISKISHEGVIVGISEEYITVEFVNKSACASCHAKGVCAASDESIRQIEIPYNISSLVEEYKVGEKVNILLTSSMGLRAVWVSYVIPLFVLLAALMISNTFDYRALLLALQQKGIFVNAFPLLSNFKDLVMGMLSLTVIALYYIVVYLFRNKLSKVFTFSIERII